MQNEQVKTKSPLTRIGLTNNQLKLIAMIAMACDHVGKILLPEVIILQVIGRLAFPIFAYMIAEGCKYTKNRSKYLLQIALLVLLCQVVFYIAMQSLYQNIFITFTLSIMTIFAIDRFINKKNLLNFAIAILVVAISFFFGYALYGIISFSDYYVDYGYLGVLFPIVIYFAPNKWLKLISGAIIMLIYGFCFDYLQFFMLLTIPLLLLYNGKRGKANLKYVFYFFYPLHLVIIYGVYVIQYLEYFLG